MICLNSAGSLTQPEVEKKNFEKLQISNQAELERSYEALQSLKPLNSPETLSAVNSSEYTGGGRIILQTSLTKRVTLRRITGFGLEIANITHAGNFTDSVQREAMTMLTSAQYIRQEKLLLTRKAFSTLRWM